MKRLLPALALVLLATGCGNDDGAATSAAGSDHNDADITFVQGMIPHHEQAVEMSRLAATRAASADVKELAGHIEDAQAPEIEQMNGFLTDWGVEPSASEHGGGHGDAAGHQGMLSEDELAQLEGASGTDFDRLFLEGMIRHHEGAVMASQIEEETGLSDDAQELAGQIIEAQEAEIAEMESLLTAL